MQGSVGDFVNRALKYLLEGLAVAVAAIYIPKRSLPLDEIAALALVAAAVFALLDVLVRAAGKDDEFRLVLLQPMHVQVKSLLGSVVAAVVDADAEAASRLDLHAGGLTVSNQTMAFINKLVVDHYYERRGIP